MRLDVVVESARLDVSMWRLPYLADPEARRHLDGDIGYIPYAPTLSVEMNKAYNGRD